MTMTLTTALAVARGEQLGELEIAARWLADFIDPPTFSERADKLVHAVRYDHDDTGQLWRRSLCGGLVPVKLDAAPADPPEYAPSARESCRSCSGHLPAHRRPNKALSDAQRPIRPDTSEYRVEGRRTAQDDTAPGVCLTSPTDVPVYVSTGPVELVELNRRAVAHARAMNKRVA